MLEMVCPLDYRYGREELKALFSEEAKLRYYLKVEVALAKALAKYDLIPQEGADAIAKAVEEGMVKLERVRSLESEIKHDVMAMVLALSEMAGIGSKYVHYGATSYDIVDTANALQIRDALGYIKADLKALILTLCNLAERYKNTLMVGRTHGQHALPITFGLKMAVFAAEVERHYIRIEEAEGRICVGKLSGAVGTMASLGPRAIEIQRYMLEDLLGLGIELPATQIVQRDRYIELMSIVTNIATTMEKFATEIRNLQRTEIGECAEAFDVSKQVGSSTMAHKKNPITCENISGLSRVIRGMLIPAFENAIQWHERDLANSSAERFIIPHSLILLDDIIVKMNNIFSNLVVNENRMRANLEMTNGVIMAEAVMMALVKKGWSRQEAHEVIRKASMQAQTQGISLKDALIMYNDVMASIGNEIEDILDPENYIGMAPKLVDITVKRLRDAFGRT